MEALLHQGLPPDGIIYNALVSACEQGVLQQRAFELSESRLYEGLLSDGITSKALVSSCVKGVLQLRALDFLEAMLHQGLLSDVIIYNALVMPARRVRCRREPWNSSRECCTKSCCQKWSPTTP